MRGVAHDPVLRAKLMAQHEAGIPLSVLSATWNRSPGALALVGTVSAADRGLAAAEPATPPLANASPGGRRRDLRYVISVGAWPDCRRARSWPWDRAARARGAGASSSRAARPVHRYEKTRPGELLHLDLKYLPQLGNRPEFEYAAIDDFSREAAAMIAGERTPLRPRGFSSMCWRSCHTRSPR